MERLVFDSSNDTVENINRLKEQWWTEDELDFSFSNFVAPGNKIPILGDKLLISMEKCLPSSLLRPAVWGTQHPHPQHLLVCFAMMEISQSTWLLKQTCLQTYTKTLLWAIEVLCGKRPITLHGQRLLSLEPETSLLLSNIANCFKKILQRSTATKWHMNVSRLRKQMRLITYIHNNPTTKKHCTTSAALMLKP